MKKKKDIKVKRNSNTDSNDNLNSRSNQRKIGRTRGSLSLKSIFFFYF